MFTPLSGMGEVVVGVEGSNENDFLPNASDQRDHKAGSQLKKLILSYLLARFLIELR